MAKIIVQYNGVRFPRTVNLRGNQHISFQRNRLQLTLDEYDAMLLLKANTRVRPEAWEFTIVGVITQDQEVKNEEKDEKKEKVLGVQVGSKVTWRMKKKVYEGVVVEVDVNTKEAYVLDASDKTHLVVIDELQIVE